MITTSFHNDSFSFGNELNTHPPESSLADNARITVYTFTEDKVPTIAQLSKVSANIKGFTHERGDDEVDIKRTMSIVISVPKFSLFITCANVYVISLQKWLTLLIRHAAPHDNNLIDSTTMEKLAESPENTKKIVDEIKKRPSVPATLAYFNDNDEPKLAFRLMCLPLPQKPFSLLSFLSDELGVIDTSQKAHRVITKTILKSD